MGLRSPAGDGRVVRVAFALDTCDAKPWPGARATGGISGEMIRDLMLEKRRAALWHRRRAELGDGEYSCSATLANKW